MPWRRERVETRRRSFWPLLALERRRSRVVVSLIATVDGAARGKSCGLLSACCSLFLSFSLFSVFFKGTHD